ncbi:OmpP1/FadL family transporter [Halotia branconii]|uniref:Outer membrane protein transport protein n=1 Tax=Halotia branconii CENA392 TaxID=1539056 RepID=A0AAJ6NQQ5_9CYAN|nr:outer membrane protein transport protein [Halotia branconii]WGV24759.1 outer membrane protein transport protein [Halotia branconii CENA392]
MKQLRINLSLIPILTVLTVGTMPNLVLAGGFALNEQSVKGLGNAFAGSAATADDASTIFFNPAGLTRLTDDSIVGAGYVIFPTVSFQNQGSTVATGAPLSGGNGGEAGVDIAVPNFYAAWSLSDTVKAGIGINVPFGLATTYNRDWVGRYQAVESKLATININPTLAAKLSDNFSVGAGLNVQYAEATLSNAIDFGLIGRSVGLPTQPQQADGFVKVTGSDWSVGYNLGVMYEPSKSTRIGLSYRSPITQDIRGNADFTVPASARALTARGQFTDTGASAVVKLPDTLSLAIYQELNPRVSLVGDVTWTHWSRFQELRVKFDNPAQADSVQPENWDDTYRFGLGVNYAVNDRLTLRTGVTYDPSPISDEFVTARLPGGDRTLVGIGASYQPSKSLSFDVGYTHVFAEDSPINQSGSTTGTLKGKFASEVDIIGVQLNWQF